MRGWLGLLGIAAAFAACSGAETPRSSAPVTADAGREGAPTPTGPEDEPTVPCRVPGEEVPIPPSYAAMSSTLAAGDAVALARGKATYDAWCADCHGSEGHGDGRRAPLQTVPPTDFRLKRRPDTHLFWRISEGGAPPFCSSMPVGKGFLSVTERWQLVAYVQTLALPADAGSDAGR